MRLHTNLNLKTAKNGTSLFFLYSYQKGAISLLLHTLFYTVDYNSIRTHTVLQGGQFAVIEKGNFLEFLMILSYFKHKNHHFGHF